MAGMEVAPPEIFESAKEPRPISSTTRLVSIVSQTGAVSQGSKLVFQIPNGGNSYIKPNSMYLRFNVTCTNPVGAQVSYQFPTRDASALFSRFTLSYGSQQIEQLNNYNQWSSHLLTHAASSGYVTNDARILSFCGSGAAAAGANYTATNNIIPVLSGFFANRAVPQFLFSSPFLVEFDLVANAVEAIYDVLGANAPTGVQIDANATLCFEQIVVDASYVERVRSAVQQGALWQSTINNVLALQVSHAQSINYNIGVNLSSIRGLFWTTRVASTGIANTAFQQGNTNLARLYLDGRLINQYNLDSGAVQYAEMNRALGNLFDTNITSNAVLGSKVVRDAGGAADTTIIVPVAIDRTNLASTFYLGGINVNRFNDSSLVMCGQSAQQIQFEYGSTVANGTLYIYVVYDSLVMVDGNGAMSIQK